jgi:type I restriction enzyme, S subunit
VPAKLFTAGEVGTFRGGSGFPTRYQGGKSEELPFFKVSDMNNLGNKLFMRRANNYISEFQRKAIGAVRIPAGAIVFAKVGAAVFLERKRILAQDSCIDNNMAAFIVDQNRVDVRFAHYLLTAFNMSSLVATTALPSLNSGQLCSMPLLLPENLEEQRRVVNALGEADEMVAALERMITKKQAIKKGMMQQLLTGKSRLPGLVGRWVTAPLKEFMPLQRGFDLPNSQVIPGPYPVVYSNGVARHHAKAIVKGPGVVTGRSGTIGKVHFVEKDYWPHNTSLWVTNFDRVDPRFAYYFLSHIGLERFASGSGVPTFNRNDAHSFVVTLPVERGEQIAIAFALKGADAELAILGRRLVKTRDLKQGMMQELLTGRTRLPVREAAA